MDIDNRIKMRARRSDISFGGDTINLYAYQRDSHSQSVAKKIELVQCEKYVTPEVFAEIEMQEAQILMDDLWAAGVRPTEGSGSAGAMKAVMNHLDDMRKIAFKKLDICQP